MRSAVLIVPAALKPAADAVGEAMGWGPENYTIPLGVGGIITHYGCRADVSDLFVAWITGAEPLPDPAAQPVVDALIADFSPSPTDPDAPILWGRDHLDAVLAAHGLVPAEPDRIFEALAAMGLTPVAEGGL